MHGHARRVAIAGRGGYGLAAEVARRAAEVGFVDTVRPEGGCIPEVDVPVPFHAQPTGREIQERGLKHVRLRLAGGDGTGWRAGGRQVVAGERGAQVVVAGRGDLSQGGVDLVDGLLPGVNSYGEPLLQL